MIPCQCVVGKTLKAQDIVETNKELPLWFREGTLHSIGAEIFLPLGAPIITFPIVSYQEKLLEVQW